MKLKDLIDIPKQYQFWWYIWSIIYLKMVFELRDTKEPILLESRKVVLLITSLS